MCKLALFWSNNLSFKYQRFTPSGCRDIGIKKVEFETKTQSLCCRNTCRYRKYYNNNFELEKETVITKNNWMGRRYLLNYLNVCNVITKQKVWLDSY